MRVKTGFSFALALLLIVSVAISQESPQFPHLFYGSSKIDGLDTPAGAVIIAKVGGLEKGKITTTESGLYGGVVSNQEKLLVQGNIAEGEVVEFYIATVKANEVDVFDSGKIENLNLTWTFPARIQINAISVKNEPIIVKPGTPVVINISGLVINITSDNITSGMINNVTDLGKGFFVTSSPPSGLLNTSNVFEISLGGNFSIVISMKYGDAGINEATVAVYKFVGGAWTSIPSSDIISIDTSTNTVNFRIPSGGTPYTIFAQSASPPSSPIAGTGGTAPPPGPASVNVSNVTQPQPTPNATAVNETQPEITPSIPAPAPETSVAPAPSPSPITGFVTLVTSPTGLVVSLGVLVLVAAVVYAKAFRKRTPWRTDYAYTPKYQGHVLDSLKSQIENRRNRMRDKQT